MIGIGTLVSPWARWSLWRRIAFKNVAHDRYTLLFTHKLGQNRLISADALYTSCDELVFGRTKGRGFEHLRRLILLFDLHSQAGDFALIALFRVHTSTSLSYAIPTPSVSQPRVSIACLPFDSFPKPFPNVFPISL